MAAINRLKWLPPEATELARELFKAVHVKKSWACDQLFRPPAFRMSEQSEAAWKREVLKECEKFCDIQLERWRPWVRAGFDERVDESDTKPDKHRGPGKTGRNVSVDARYEWAALRALGLHWKSIAGRYLPCKSEQELTTAVSRVQKAANKILRSAKLAPIQDSGNRK